MVGYLFSECLKHRINPYDFTDAIASAQLNDDSVAVLSQFYDRIVCYGDLIHFRRFRSRTRRQVKVILKGNKKPN